VDHEACTGESDRGAQDSHLLAPAPPQLSTVNFMALQVSDSSGIAVESFSLGSVQGPIEGDEETRITVPGRSTNVDPGLAGYGAM